MNRAATIEQVATVLDILAPFAELPPGLASADGNRIRLPQFMIDHQGQAAYPDLADVRALAERIAGAVVNATSLIPVPTSGATLADLRAKLPAGPALSDLAIRQAYALGYGHADNGADPQLGEDDRAWEILETDTPAQSDTLPLS